jgi:hypothetical protein
MMIPARTRSAQRDPTLSHSAGDHKPVRLTLGQTEHQAQSWTCIWRTNTRRGKKWAKNDGGGCGIDVRRPLDCLLQDCDSFHARPEQIALTLAIAWQYPPVVRGRLIRLFRWDDLLLELCMAIPLMRLARFIAPQYLFRLRHAWERGLAERCLLRSASGVVSNGRRSSFGLVAVERGSGLHRPLLDFHSRRARIQP